MKEFHFCNRLLAIEAESYNWLVPEVIIFTEALMHLVYPLSVYPKRIWKQYGYVQFWRVKEVLSGLGENVNAAIFLA